MRIVVATPCFGGQLTTLYAISMFKLQAVLRGSADIEIKLLLKEADALITRARASLVAQFLDDPDATHLLFIDADIGFEPAQVLRLINFGADMCAAIYPIKSIDWDGVKAAVEAGRSDLQAAALNYVYEVADRDSVEARAGFAKVRYAGTGFLMIRRQALERMCAHYPNLRFERDHSAEAATASSNRYALFDCMIDETGTYLSEDYSFCHRWTAIGGEIWADLSSGLNHVGPYVFRGDFSSQFAPMQPQPSVA
jgi:hypothetical protein